MGRKSKIKHLEKNGYSKFEQVLVEKQDKKLKKGKPETSKGQTEQTETSGPSRPDENESPKKPDGLKKFEVTQVRKETLETSKLPQTTKNTESLEIIQKSENPDRPDEYDCPKNANGLKRSQGSDGFQVKSQKTSELTTKPVPPKGQRGKTEMPEEPQKLESQEPDGLQIKSQKTSELTKKPETSKGQREKTEGPKEPQKFETPSKPDENENHKKPDRLDKSKSPEGPQVKSQDRSEIPKNIGRPEILQKTENLDRPNEPESSKKPDELIKPQKSEEPQVMSEDTSEAPWMIETRKGQRKKTKWAEQPDKAQKFENPNRPDEYYSRKKTDGLQKSQRPEVSQINSQKRSETSYRPDTPKGQRKNTKWPEKSQKFGSPPDPIYPIYPVNIPDEHESYKKPDLLEKSQRPEGPQIKNLERPETSKRSETPKGQRKNKKWPDRPQKFESPNRTDQYESTKNDKPQMSETPQILAALEKDKPLEEPERPDTSEIPVKPEKLEKSESKMNFEAEEPQIIEKISDEEVIKHPLEHTWGMWLITNDKRNWEDNLVKLTTFSFVEDYWCLFHHMKPPSELERGKDFAVFKDGLRPMWEDSANREGGRWLINFDKKRSEPSDLDSIWMYVILLMIGENFCVPNSICGAVVSIRAKNRIAVWVPNYRNELAVKDVGNTLRNTLGLRGRLAFQQHNTATSIFTM